MSTKLSGADQELYRRVDEVLHYVWDPIGVSTIPTARDEYNAYVPQVFALLKENADALDIAAYLTRVVRVRMAMSEDSADAQRVADVLVAWREKVRMALSY